MIPPALDQGSGRTVQAVFANQPDKPNFFETVERDGNFPSPNDDGSTIQRVDGDWRCSELISARSEQQNLQCQPPIQNQNELVVTMLNFMILASGGKTDDSTERRLSCVS